MKKTRRQKIEGPALRREQSFKVDSAILDEEQRLLRVSFSSMAPVLRRSFWEDDWVEILGHSENEVQLDRLNTGAPVLYNHARSDDWSTRDTRIGVVTKAWLEKDRGEAEIKISRRDDVAGYWQDIADGVLCNVSVGYKIHERVLVKDNGGDSPDEYRVTSWEPLEISLVDIPADYSVGVGRSEPRGPAKYRVIDLPEQETTVEDDEDIKTEEERTETPPAQETNTDEIKAQARKEALEIEQRRRKAIRSVFEYFPQHNELRDQCLDDSAVTTNDARKRLLDALGRPGGKPAEPGADPNHRVDMGTTDREKFVRAAENWIGVKAGLKKFERDGQNEYNGYSLRELLRRSLELAGISTRGLDETQMLQRAISHGASDFPLITENIANKAMMQGFMDAEETYQIWTQTGTLGDFKVASRIETGGFNSLREVRRGAEFKSITTTERGERIQLATYGEMFSIDRQTIIDDDVGAFTGIPMELGVAARGTVGDLVYGVLIDNADMADGDPLFDGNHNNLLTGALISTASTDAMRVAMSTQKRPGVTARSANISLAYLLVPRALEGIANQVRTSQYEIGADPTGSAVVADATSPNYMQNRFGVVAESRLDDDDPAVWYGAAGRRTIEVAYLNGRSEPTIERMDGWTVLGVTWRVYLDAAAKALDWKTLAKNPGAGG